MVLLSPLSMLLLLSFLPLLLVLPRRIVAECSVRWAVDRRCVGFCVSSLLGVFVIACRARVEWVSSSNCVAAACQNGVFALSVVARQSSSNSYKMYTACAATGFNVTTTIPVEGTKVYTTVYFVVEHQPDSCDQLPADGTIVFTDIAVQWEGKTVDPAWKAFPFQDACNCTGVVVSPSSLAFTWDIHGTVPSSSESRST